MLFRSTEFIDDVVRDIQATNKMEIADFGWAFGQIADMEAWYNSLKNAGKLNNNLGQPQSFSVTGYSLGGHLATAFALLHQSEGRIAGTYTFNGAGVGSVASVDVLRTVVNRFDAQRKNIDGQQIMFTDAAVRAAYETLRSRITGGVKPTTTEIALVTSIVPATGQANLERNTLVSALTRISTIMDEVARVAGVTDSSSPPKPPAQISGVNVEATRLDYQLAVLEAQRSTASYRTDPLSAFVDGYSGRHTVTPSIPNFYDIYGDTVPSSVSNSQYHYGAATPIFIEDQPLYRGSVIWDAIKQSAKYLDAKLLVSGFRDNDFGDTHSLVLLVDSLSVMNVLARLDTGFTADTAKTIFQLASNLKSQEDNSYARSSRR